jgi:hypothetical protein
MKQFIRNFRKQKTVGILNIFSLSIGIMVFIIVGLWAIHELRFDNFHKNKDRIYRVNNNLSDMESCNNESGRNNKIELLIIDINKNRIKI